MLALTMAALQLTSRARPPPAPSGGGNTAHTTHNTLTDFGYYYEGCDGAGPACTMPAANHSTSTFVSSANVPARLAALLAANISAVVTCEGLFINGTSTLWPDYQQKWDAYWATTGPHSASILAFYPVDEPSPALIASGVYGAILH